MGRVFPVLLGVVWLGCGCAVTRLPCAHRPADPSPVRAQPLTGAYGHDDGLRATKAALAAVVHIRTKIRPAAGGEAAGHLTLERGFRSGGSGVVIGSDGLILTAAHVIEDAFDVEVVLGDGMRYRPTCILADPDMDLAVLRIDASDLPALAVAPAGPSPGMPVFAFGRLAPGAPPAERAGAVTAGSLSLQQRVDPGRRRDYGDLIESTTDLAAGFSGGPLLDSDGRLLGLNVAVAGRAASRRGYAVRLSDRVHQAIMRLRAAAAD